MKYETGPVAEAPFWSGRPLRVLLLAAPANAGVERALAGLGMAFVTEHAASREALARSLLAFFPDVVLADLEFDPVHPTAALDVVRATRPGVPLIVLTDALDEHAAVACLKGGADDLVIKRNASRLGPSIETALALRQPLARLTPRQMEVFRLVTEGDTTREIARRLAISVKTVESHRSAAMQRLEIHSLAGLIHYAMCSGVVGGCKLRGPRTMATAGAPVPPL